VNILFDTVLNVLNCAAKITNAVTRIVPDWLFQIQLEPDLAGFRNSKPAGAGSGFGDNSFSNQRTIRVTKLRESAMLSAAIKGQYSSVLPFLCHCLPVFDKICGLAMNFVFLIRVTLIKIVNTSLDRSAALVLSITNCTAAAVASGKFGRSRRAGFGQTSKKWPDNRFNGAGAEIQCNPSFYGSYIPDRSLSLWHLRPQMATDEMVHDIVHSEDIHHQTERVLPRHKTPMTLSLREWLPEVLRWDTSLHQLDTCSKHNITWQQTLCNVH